MSIELKLFSPKTVGVDLFDNPLKAVMPDKGMFINEKLEEVFFKLPAAKPYLTGLKTLLEGKYYWGDFEVIQMLLKYINKASGSKLLKPKLVILIPEEIYTGRFGNLFARMLIEAGLSSSWSQVILIDNFSCAAIGSGILISSNDEAEQCRKKLFIYSNDYCTYFGAFYSGQIIAINTIESDITKLSKIEVESAVTSLWQSIPAELPQGFYDNNMCNQGWSLPLEKLIYLSVADSLKNMLGNHIADYQLLFAPNHETCIVDGLLKISDKSYLIHI